LDALTSFLILLGITAGMLVLMGLTFALHWIVFRVYRRLRPVHCPSCGRFSSESMVVGKTCRACGENMAPWLYVTG
jgi:hypothetical protein